MPTGYTAKISDGISFPEFAMDCARAFGALIEMRDAPDEAKIPDEFSVSDYYPNKIAEHEKDMRNLLAMSDAECDACAIHAFNSEVARLEKRIQDDEILKAKYEAMLDRVNAWVPPSEEHVNFKAFMRQQIKDSIDFDCSGTYNQEALSKAKLMSGAQWKAMRLAEIGRELEYCHQKHADEVERTAKRNQWLKQLRESLR